MDTSTEDHLQDRGDALVAVSHLAQPKPSHPNTIHDVLSTACAQAQIIGQKTNIWVNLTQMLALSLSLCQAWFERNNGEDNAEGTLWGVTAGFTSFRRFGNAVVR